MAEETIQRTEVEVTFETYRHYLHREASVASSYFRLYRRLWERRSDHLDELNVAPAFFSIASDALYSATIIWVDKLLDERGERGMFNFLSFVENNRAMLSISELQCRKNYPDGHWMLKREPITYDTVASDRTRLRELACLPAVKLRRDKFHAHFDKDYFFARERFAAEAEHLLIAALKEPPIVGLMEPVGSGGFGVLDGCCFTSFSSPLQRCVLAVPEGVWVCGSSRRR